MIKGAHGIRWGTRYRCRKLPSLGEDSDISTPGQR